MMQRIDGEGGTCTQDRGQEEDKGNWKERERRDVTERYRGAPLMTGSFSW